MRSLPRHVLLVELVALKKLAESEEGKERTEWLNGRLRGERVEREARLTCQEKKVIGGMIGR